MTLQHNQPIFQAPSQEAAIEQPVAERDEETMRRLRNPFIVDERPARDRD